ncbi:hypothetical protein O6H91_Y143400 [Diphasiastrum complanatum]|nr:hypothetical protein O6H91_Y143400 [Diphasiastrum complanatum]
MRRGKGSFCSLFSKLSLSNWTHFLSLSLLFFLQKATTSSFQPTFSEVYYLFLKPFSHFILTKRALCILFASPPPPLNFKSVPKIIWAFFINSIKMSTLSYCSLDNAKKRL